MVLYMTKYAIILNIISMFYVSGIAGKIGDKVAAGAFVNDLIRPINVFTMSWQMELANICSSFLLRELPVVIIYSPLLFANLGYYFVPAGASIRKSGHEQTV